MDMKWIPLAAAAATLLAAAVVPATMGTASAATVPGLAPAAPAFPQGAPPVPVLRWDACDDGFQCATAQVPLDYRHPGAAMISIAVIRHLATDPAQRLGTMFVNLGRSDGADRALRLGLHSHSRTAAGTVRHCFL